MFSSFTPTNETGFELHHDQTWIDGYGIGGIAFGIHVCVFFSCVYFLWQRQDRGRMTWILLAFVTSLFCCGTVLYISLTRLTELSFVTNRDYPGGPVVWYTDVGGYGTWTTVEDVAYFIAEILSDGLLLWRVWIIWEQSFLVLAFPILLYITIIGLGIPLMCIPATWNNLMVVEAWFGCATALNILLSSLIVARLLIQAHRAKTALGADHAARYTSVAVLIVESAAPFAMCNILYIANYALKTSLGCVTWPLLSQVMCISPDMIILRVALGRAWETTTRPTTNETLSGISVQRTVEFSSSPRRWISSGTPWSSHVENSIVLKAIQYRDGDSEKTDTTRDGERPVEEV